MSFTQDFFTQRRNFGDGTTRIGEHDRLWYDAITNTIRIWDGNPGGKIVGGGGDGGQWYNTRLVTTNSYTVVPDDYYIGINYPGEVTIILPMAENGDKVVIKDESGRCSINPIILSGHIDNEVDGAILQINNAAIHMIYRDGWRII